MVVVKIITKMKNNHEKNGQKPYKIQKVDSVLMREVFGLLRQEYLYLYISNPLLIKKVGEEILRLNDPFE